MILALGKLYEEGKISSRIGAGILECSRFEFYRLISEQGFAVIDYTEAEFAVEAQTSRQFAQKLTDR
jgi:predicted HTH domain antitoxin